MRRRRWWGITAVAGLLALGPAVDAEAADPAPEGTVAPFGDALAIPAPAVEDVVALATARAGLGWWAATGDGAVHAAGFAPHLGDAPGLGGVVGLAATPSGRGYWLATATGDVRHFGDAPALGRVEGRLNRPVVGVAATPTGRGYWLVASDGGIFTFGDAAFLGSTGAVRLNEPIVGMASTPTGRGYWLVASDGGVFTFGDATFAGAGRGPASAIAPTPSGRGYWIAGTDGHVDARGDAPHLGDLPSVGGAVRALAPTPSGRGYWLAVGRVTDVLTVSQPGGLHEPAQRWALDAAARAGAKVTVYHAGNLDLLTGAPAGWRLPMSSVAVEPRWAADLVGPTATAALERGELVMGARAARFRGARVGDALEVRGWDGRHRTLRLGAIAPDARVGGAELVLALGTARSMGFDRPLSVKLWGASRGALEAAIAAAPMPTRLNVDRTWQHDPDDVSPQSRLKEVLGEPAYRPGGGGDSVHLHPSFTNRITSQRVPILGAVTCHAAVFPDLRAALDDVARAGLGGTLGRYGGCYNPRLIRGGDSGGALSRHSYGIALDLNITNNSFGGRVSMHPRVVDIFRSHGFAWGGTWARADGMHFEWAPR